MNDHKLDKIFREAAEEKEFLFSVEAWNEVEAHMEALDPAQVDQVFQQGAESVQFSPGPEAWSSFVQSSGAQSGSGFFGQWIAKFGTQIVLPLATTVALVQSDVIIEKAIDSPEIVPIEETMITPEEVTAEDLAETAIIEAETGPISNDEETLGDIENGEVTSPNQQPVEAVTFASTEETNETVLEEEAALEEMQPDIESGVFADSRMETETGNTTTAEVNNASKEVYTSSSPESPSSPDNVEKGGIDHANDIPAETLVSVSNENNEDAVETGDTEQKEVAQQDMQADVAQENMDVNRDGSEPSAMTSPAVLPSSKDPSWELGLGLGARVLRLEGISSTHSPWKWSPELQLHLGYRLSDRHSLEIELRAFENTGTYESVEFSSLVYGFGPVNQKREIYASPSLQFEIPIRWRYRINERSFSSVGVFYAHQLPMELRVVDHHEEWYLSELLSDHTTQGYIEGFRYQNFGLTGSYQYRLNPKWLISGDLQYYFLDRDLVGSSAIPNTPWSLGISLRYSLIR